MKKSLESTTKIVILLVMIIITSHEALAWTDITNIAYYDFSSGSGTNVVDVWDNYNATMSANDMWVGLYPTYDVSGDGANYSIFPNTTTTGVISSVTGNLFNTGNFTVAFWIKAGTVVETAPEIFESQPGSGNYFQAYWKTSEDRLTFEGGDLASTNERFGGDLDITDSGINDDTWHHLVLIKTDIINTSLPLIYLDGVNQSVIPRPYGGSSVDVSNSQALKIGYGGSKFNGALDNFMLFNRSLTEIEITELFEYGEPQEGNYVPATPDVTLVGEGNNYTTEDLNCSATVTDSDGDSLNATIKLWRNNTLYNTTNLNNDYASGSVVDLTVISGVTAVTDVWNCEMQTYDGENYSAWDNSTTLTIVETPIPGALKQLFHYQFHEGSGSILEDTLDLENATITGSLTWSGSYPTYNVSGDGADYSGQFGSDYAETDTLTGDNLGVYNWSISFWLRSTSTSTTEIVEAQHGTDNYFQIVWDNGANHRIFANGGPLAGAQWGGYIDINTHSLDDDSWHHITMLKTGATLPEFYVDGENVSVTTMGYSGTNVDISSPSKIKIGGGTAGTWTGYLDEVRLFNTTLTLETIQEIYNTGSITESNSAPTDPSVSLVSENGNNYTSEDLNCSATISDPNSDTMNVTIKLWRNSTEYNTTNLNDDFATGTLISLPVDSSLTTIEDEWICEMRLYDGEDYSSWVNSTALTISGPVPIATLVYPKNNRTAIDDVHGTITDLPIANLTVFVSDTGGNVNVSFYYGGNNSYIDSVDTASNANISVQLTGDFGDFETWYAIITNVYGSDEVGNASFRFIRENKGDMSILILPDTQVYSENEDIPAYFGNQTQYACDLYESGHINAVIHNGDVVENGDTYTAEWDAANASVTILEECGVPYILAPGNHDYDGEATAGGRALTYWNNYFPTSRVSGKSWYGGSYEVNNYSNSYIEFSDDTYDYLVFGIEFCPSDSVLEWVNTTIENNPSKRVIYNTHLYLEPDDTWTTAGDSYNCQIPAYDTPFNNGNNGDEVYEKVIQHHDDQIILVTSGHNKGDGTGNRTDIGNEGYNVHQIFANYQIELPSGGNGKLRNLNYYETEEILEVLTYTPFFDYYDTDADQEFNLSLENISYIEVVPATGGSLLNTSTTIMLFNFNSSLSSDDGFGYSWVKQAGTDTFGVDQFGVSNTAIYFSNSNWYQINQNFNEIYSNEDVTYDLLFKCSASSARSQLLLGEGNSVISTRLSATTSDLFNLIRDDADGISVDWYNSTPIVYDDNDWHLLTMVRDYDAVDSNLYHYVDGVLHDNKTLIEDLNLVFNTGLYLGADSAGSYLSENCSISELRFQSTSVDAGEILSTYNNLFFGSSDYFRVSAYNVSSYDYIDTFNATINGSLFTTTNGTIYTTYNKSDNATSLLSINVTADGFVYNSSENINYSYDYSTGLSSSAVLGLINFYDGSLISDFNLSINGDYFYSDSGYVSSTYSGVQTLLFQSDGYFNQSISYNLDSGNANFSTYQSVIHIVATDEVTLLPITVFNVSSTIISDDVSSGVSTTNGTIEYYVDAGNDYGFNVSSASDTEEVLYINVTEYENQTVNVTLVNSAINFTLYRESTGMLFDISGANSTRSAVVCTNGNMLEQNITETNFILNTTCDWSQIIFYVDYGDGDSYFRSVIPPVSAQTEPYNAYLIDLDNGDTAVQVVIKLNDLSGDYDSATLTMTTNINDTNQDVIQTPFDASDQATVYLVKNRQYTMEVRDDNGVETNLGVVIADLPTTITITLPEIVVIPDGDSEGTPNIPNYPGLPEEVMGTEFGGENNTGGAFWDYEFDTDLHILQLVYYDPNNATTSVSFDVFNSTISKDNSSRLFVGLPLTCTNATSCVFVIQSPSTLIVENMTYYTNLTIIHETLGTINEEKVFRTEMLGNVNLGVFEENNLELILQIISIMVIGLVFFIFNRMNAGIGALTTLVVAIFFYRIDWLVISAPNVSVTIGLLTLIGGLTWLAGNRT